MNADVEGLFTCKKTVHASQFRGCDGLEDSLKESQLIICLEVFLYAVHLQKYENYCSVYGDCAQRCTSLRVASIKVQIIKTPHGYVHTNRNWTLKKLTFVDSLKSTNQMLEMSIVLQWLSNRVTYQNCLHQINLQTVLQLFQLTLNPYPVLTL